MAIVVEKVHMVFNNKVAKNWNQKDNKIKKMYGCDNPMERELDWYLKCGQTLLEVGCGSGKLIQYILNKTDHCNIVGFDVSRNMLEASRSRIDTLETKNNKVQFVLGNVETCNFKENYFDIILLKQVLHHIDDVSLTLKKLSKFLKPEGVILFMVPGPNYQKEFFSYKDTNTRDILGRFSIEYLENIILQSELIPLRLSSQRFLFEFESFYDYMIFMHDIGSLQKLYNYEEKKYEPVLELLNLYSQVLSKIKEVKISGEYVTAVCQQAKQWTNFLA